MGGLWAKQVSEILGRTSYNITSSSRPIIVIIYNTFIAYYCLS